MDKVVENPSSETVSKQIKFDDDDDDDDEERTDTDEEKNHNYLPVDLFPHEIVLSIDHILDQIFSLLDTSDLFTCRLVSHRFLKFAKIPLEKRIKLKFIKYHLEIQCPHNLGVRLSEKTLEQLTDFLEQSTLFSAREFNPIPISFPCTRFSFDRARLDDDDLQKFLNVNGTNIKHLSICSYLNRQRTHENMLMDHICSLLTRQAPNLENLFIFTHPIVEWKQPTPIEIEGFFNDHFPTRGYSSPLLKTDPEFKEITSRVESLRDKSGLKVFTFGGDGWAKVLELIIQICPKLQDVIMSESKEIYLMHPVNRVHLMKSLTWNPKFELKNRYSSRRLDLIESMSKENIFRLQKLGLDFTNALPVCQTNKEWEKRIVSVFNRIMERSQDTLECFTLTAVTFLRGMTMPSSMTRVRELVIVERDERFDTMSTIFPTGFLLSETFPNLTCVKLIYRHDSDDLMSFYTFLNCLDFQGKDDPALSFSVNKVILSVGNFHTSEVVNKIPAFVFDRVQKLFPNARIQSYML